MSIDWYGYDGEGAMSEQTDSPVEPKRCVVVSAVLRSQQGQPVRR